MMTRGGRQVSRCDLPKGQNLVHVKTKRSLVEGDIVLRDGDTSQYRILSVLINRQRVLIIDIEKEDRDNPYDRREVEPGSISAKFI